MLPIIINSNPSVRRRKDGNCYSRKEGTYMEHEFQKKIHELIDKITDEETLSFIYKIVVRLM